MTYAVVEVVAGSKDVVLNGKEAVPQSTVEIVEAKAETGATTPAEETETEEKIGIIVKITKNIANITLLFEGFPVRIHLPSSSTASNGMQRIVAFVSSLIFSFL